MASKSSDKRSSSESAKTTKKAKSNEKKKEEKQEKEQKKQVDPPIVEPTIVIPDTQSVENTPADSGQQNPSEESKQPQQTQVPSSQPPTQEQSTDQTETSDIKTPTPPANDAQNIPEPIQQTPPVTSPAATPQTQETPEVSIPDTSVSISGQESPPPETLASTQDFVPEQSAGSKLKLVIIFMIALLIGGASVASYFYLMNPDTFMMTDSDATHNDDNQINPDISTEPEASVSAASPTETDVDISTLYLQILNGSGVAGTASSVETTLTIEGFKKYTLGNADSYNYTDTEVQLSESVPESVFIQISEALENDGYSVKKSSSLLTNKSPYDIVIIVGTK